MVNEKSYKNWQITIDEDAIVWLNFNNQNAAINTLHSDAVYELNDILDSLLHTPAHKALIIASSKDTGFCMGADINEFEKETDLSVIQKYVELGQTVMQKIADLPFTSIALIHGFCVGGGLELALACRYRIAQEDSAQLGLPEVRLGLQPAWGGTVRLPRLVHPFKAMNMMLTGRMVNASAAKKMQLVDVIVPKRQMHNAAHYVALHGLKKRKKTLAHVLCYLGIVRRIAAILMRKQVAKQASPAHYPAPFKIIDNWQKYGTCNKRAYSAEVEGFIQLLSGNTAKNLIRLFFLQEALKSVGKKNKWRAQHIHVVGAGVMGGDIAAWCMLKGLKVSLQDKTPQDLSRAMARAYQLCEQQIKNKGLIKYTMDRLIPDTRGDGIAHADIVLEAIFEDLSAKQALLHQIADKIKPDTIVATNTSSISLKELKKGFSHASQLVGIHFFNPVAKMQLVEVVHTDEVKPDISERALAFVHQISKLPLKVKDGPGFLVNRVIAPYLLETVHLLDEGVSVVQLDQAARDFGMMMGPVTLVDLIGLDICLAAVKNLGGQAPKILVEKVEAGHLGRKTGEGFYRYLHDGKIQRPSTHKAPSPMSTHEILDRLLLPLINECVACLGERIVATTDDIDAGIIFGMGFAPFRGGPMQFAKSVGYTEIYEKLKSYEAVLGYRFKPKPGWSLLLNH